MAESSPITTEDDGEYVSPHYWNYRVRLTFHGPFGDNDSEEEEEYDIIEAYYSRESDAITMWAPCTTAAGGTVTELREDLELMLGALGRPVLLDSELPKSDD